jgi:hypothetical protein
VANGKANTELDHRILKPLDSGALTGCLRVRCLALKDVGCCSGASVPLSMTGGLLRAVVKDWLTPPRAQGYWSEFCFC